MPDVLLVGRDRVVQLITEFCFHFDLDLSHQLVVFARVLLSALLGFLQFQRFRHHLSHASNFLACEM
jgi:hypothetical protein